MPSKFQREPKNICPSCGAENSLGRPFCTNCGVPMYRGGQPRRVKHMHGGPVRALRNTLLSLVLVSLATAATLSCWPFPPTGTPGNAMETPIVRRVLADLAQASQPGHAPANKVVTESMANGYALARVQALRQQDGYGSYWRRYPVELRVDFRSERVTVVARERLGPIDSSTRIVLVPQGEPSAFAVQSVWRGHLPLPKRFAVPMARRLAERFDLELPPILWESVKATQADDQRLALTAAPISPSPSKEAPHAR